MKKIILVPHTHWDREWYFTDQTSSILLQRLKEDLETSQTVFPFLLDGQASLIEEMKVDYDPKFINDHQITVGPLYVQQDTYNVLIGTTINNIEVGKKVAKVAPPKTVYMPDSFGFNEQLPQIFKHYGFDNFVFWRGIKPEDKQKSNLFYWEGYDGTKILSSVMAEGYYCMGQYYPYNQEQSYDNFKQEFIKQVQRLEKRRDQNVYWIPLGGDQAPYEVDVTKAVKFINQSQTEYKVVIGTLDQYFNEVDQQELPIIKHRLDYSGTSKIHRTIHSNRYDIKKSFRDVELLIYYKMEPLEIMYQKMGGQLLSQFEKDQHIYKELLKSSVHDSLGGCNTDETNQLILARNLKIKSYVQSYIDLIVREFKENLHLQKDQLLVINPSPFTRDIFFRDVISNDSTKIIVAKNDQIIEYDQEDISWKYHHKVINHFISINVKDLKPFSYQIIKIASVKRNDAKTTNANKINFSVKVEDNLGDLYDFAYGKQEKIQIYDQFTHIFTTGVENHQVSKYIIKKIGLEMYLFSNETESHFQIFVKNKFKNKRISLVFKNQEPTILSRHLAFIEQKLDKIANWQEKGYKDWPLNAFANDGLIKFGDLNILTKGNNEVFIDQHNVEMILYRTSAYLGRPNLNTRPGPASGLPMKCRTPDAQLLNKQLMFEIGISKENSVRALNKWYFEPVSIFGGNTNLILNNVERFVVNNKKIKIELDNIKERDIDQELFGRLKWTGSEVEAIYSKPNDVDQIGKIYYEKVKFTTF